ncbi:MAG: hypothetical protein WC466_09710 [Candidatus Izemoplasmatales bacterium]
MKEIEHILSETVRHHQRRRFLFLFLISVLAINGIIHTVWENGSGNASGSIIDLEPGIVLTISEPLQSSPGTQLVPEGAFLGPRDVEEIIFTYRVRFNVSGELLVEIAELNGPLETYLNHLFEFEITGDGHYSPSQLSYQVDLEKEQNEEKVETLIQVRIRMKASGTEAEWRALQGQKLTLTLRFMVLANKT